MCWHGHARASVRATSLTSAIPPRHLRPWKPARIHESKAGAATRLLGAHTLPSHSTVATLPHLIPSYPFSLTISISPLFPSRQGANIAPVGTAIAPVGTSIVPQGKVYAPVDRAYAPVGVNLTPPKA